MRSAESDATRYSERWAELNRELRSIELGAGGLAAALSELGLRQREDGFVRDDLSAMRRYRFADPDDPSRFLRVQFNPTRARRFLGSGTSTPPVGVGVLHDGCFLCAGNIEWQQSGLELGYEIDLVDARYIAWMNPFPLTPDSCVIARADHVPQGWSANGTGATLPRVEEVLRHMIAVAQRLPGHLGFHNGVGAGASIPGHLHYHFFKRQESDRAFPLEAAARRGGLGAQGRIEGYPVGALYWRGDPEYVAGTAIEWMREWAYGHRHQEAILSANLVVAFDNERGLELYFVPRDKRRSHSPEMSGGIGGLEILGELSFCTEGEGRRLERGEIDYHSLERILASVDFD